MRSSLVVLIALIACAGSSVGAAANGRIVFVTGDGMASMNPDGTGQWGLRYTRIGQAHPSWAPDGSALVVSDATVTGQSRLFTMQPDGTGVRQVTQVGSAYDPAWSPDGGTIAFDDGSTIYTIHPDGSGIASLTAGVAPSWSPDGAAIVFERSGANGDSDLYIVAVRTGATRQLTTGPRVDAHPSWSRALDRVVFAGRADDWCSSLYTVSPAGGDVQRLTPGGSDDRDPDWSPDGTRIVFVRDRQIWTVQADGTGAQPLTGTVFSPSSPAWQPLPPAPAGCTLWGTPANDLLVGADGNDVICGLAGDDSLIGLGGGDVLYGGDGADWLAGGLGLDFFDGGYGDDVLDARDGDRDDVHGGAGVDTALIDARVRELRYGVERVRLGRNVAVWRPTTASSDEPTNPSVLAVDSRLDDYWSSGAYPTQWIEVDLRQPTTIDRLRLVAPDLPFGMQVIVLGKGVAAAAAYHVLHLFDGPAAFMQELTFTPKRAWRGVRYVRLVVPAANVAPPWVSWPEIEVYGAPTPMPRA
jgi:TolB protein